MGILDSLFGAARVKTNEAVENIVSSETQMKAHILKLKDTLSESNSKFIRFKTKLDIIKEDISKQRTEIARIDKGIQSMQEKFKNLSEDEKASQKAKFTQNAQVLLDQKHEFENKLEALVKQSDDLSPMIDQLQQAVETVKSDLKKSENDLASLSTRGSIADTQSELAEAILETRSSTDPSKSKLEEDIQRREATARNQLESVKKATATDYQDILSDVERQEKPKESASDLFK